MAVYTFSSVAYGTLHAPPSLVERSHLERAHSERFAHRCRIASVQGPTGDVLPVAMKAGDSVLDLRVRAATHFNVDVKLIDLLLGNEGNLDDECLIVLGISGCDHAVKVVVRRDTPLQAILREAYPGRQHYGQLSSFVGLPSKDEETDCVRVKLILYSNTEHGQRVPYINDGVFDPGAGNVKFTGTAEIYDYSRRDSWGLTKSGLMPEEVSWQISIELADEVCRPWGRMRTILLSFADESTGPISIHCCDVGGTLLSTVTVPGENRLDSLYKEIAGTLGISQDLLQLLLPDGTLGKTLPASMDLESIRDRHGSS